MELRQIGIKSVAIWKMLRYKSGDQILTTNLYNFVTSFLEWTVRKRHFASYATNKFLAILLRNPEQIYHQI